MSVYRSAIEGHIRCAERPQYLGHVYCALAGEASGKDLTVWLSVSHTTNNSDTTLFPPKCLLCAFFPQCLCSVISTGVFPPFYVGLNNETISRCLKASHKNESQQKQPASSARPRGGFHLRKTCGCLTVHLATRYTSQTDILTEDARWRLRKRVTTAQKARYHGSESELP